jgi:hypothetical protein
VHGKTFVEAVRQNRFEQQDYVRAPTTIQRFEHGLCCSEGWRDHKFTVCLVGEPRERSGADPLPRLFGWGAAGAEPLPREYTLQMRVGSVPQSLRDGAAPLPFSSSVSPPSRCCLSLVPPSSSTVAGRRCQGGARGGGSHPRRRLPCGETHGGGGRAEAGAGRQRSLPRSAGRSSPKLVARSSPPPPPIENEQNSPRPVVGFAQGGGAGCAPC